MAEASGCQMAPHACEGPIDSIAILHVDAAMPIFIAQEICSREEATFEGALCQERLGFPARTDRDLRRKLPSRSHDHEWRFRCSDQPRLPTRTGLPAALGSGILRTDGVDIWWLGRQLPKFFAAESSSRQPT